MRSQPAPLSVARAGCWISPLTATDGCRSPGRQRLRGSVMTIGAHADDAAQDAHGLNVLAASATLHCLVGCAIGEFAGMAIATAAGWGNAPQIGLAVALAYVFGFGLTAMPLLRAGLGAAAVVSTALAADTVSITVMEAIDNLTVAVWPGAMDAGLGELLFYGSIAVGFAIAFPFAFLANRYMIARGRGHGVVHHHHGM
jgi:hypothetical protein